MPALTGIVVALWAVRLALAVAAQAFGLHALSKGEFFRPGSTLLSSFFNWDAARYLDIAIHGYHEPNLRVLFPGYPLLERAFSHLGTGYEGAGLLVTFVSLFFACLGLSRLALTELGEEQAIFAAFLLAFFPVSVFLTTGYPEATEIALTTFSFLFVMRRQFLPAAFLAAGAETMRPDAGAVGLTVILACWLSEKQVLKRLLTSAVALAGSAAYAVYSWVAFGDPLSFVHEQNYWARKPTFPFAAEFSSFYHIFAGGLAIVGKATRANEIWLYLVDDLAVFGAIAAVVAGAFWARHSRLALLLTFQAAVVLLGSFSSAPYEGTSPDIAAHIVMTVPLVYLVAAKLLSRPAFMLPAAAVFAVCAFAIQAAFAGGYWVT